MNGGVRRLDLIGAGLFGTAIGWTLLAAGVGDPVPVAGTFAGAAAAVLVARAVGTVSRSLVPGAVVVAGAIVAYLSRDDLLSAAPLSGPFGYANAKGAFFMLVTIAGLMVAVAASSLMTRALGLTLAVGAAAVPFVSHVTTSSILVATLPLPAVLGAEMGPRAARVVVVTCGVLFILAVATSGLLAVAYARADDSRVPSSVEEALSSDRLQLWSEAVTIIADHPATGVGPGRFRLFSPTALASPANLLFWAHNEFLQQGAELGVAGLVLLILLFVWGFARLWLNETPDAVTALGAVALLMVGVQASVDYPLHFAPIALVSAALVATGMVPADARRVGPCAPEVGAG